MANTKEHIGFSEQFQQESEAIKKALESTSLFIIAETKALNSYMVVADEKGNIKKIPAKDL